MLSSYQPLLPDSNSRPVRWSHLFGAGLSLAIAKASEQYDGVLCVALSDARQVQIVAEELNFFLGEGGTESQKQGPGQRPGQVQIFPEWETLAYDIFSPHQDIISSRLKLLAAMPELQTGILLTTTESLLQRLPPLDYVLAHSFTLASGSTVNLEKLRLTS